MKLLCALEKIILLFIITTFSAPTAITGWNHENEMNWGEDFPMCDGDMQSPIALNSDDSINSAISAVNFENYNEPLRTPFLIQNNGHTVNTDIPLTQSENRPSIMGALLMDRYKAISLHFHWGSNESAGSEHVIDGRRYDGEMHIVHINDNSDGLVVLAFMIEKSDSVSYFDTPLNIFFEQAEHIKEYNSETEMFDDISLLSLFRHINVNDFYTYNGSLTTPPCAEAVTFIVFPEPVQVREKEFEELYNLEQESGEPLINNFRPLKELNGRDVFRRSNDA